jgi:hypothetical protein
MKSSEFLWQRLADLFAGAMRLLPRRLRYSFALRLARAITRVAAPLLMKRPDRYGWSTPVEETIRSILRTMARRGIAFDPRIREEVDAHLMEASPERGAIFVGAHFPLNGLVSRYLYDRGLHAVAVEGIAGSHSYIWGTSVRIDAVSPAQTILLTLRERLRKGHLVLIVLDRAKEEERTQLVDTAAGPIPVATPIFAFAKRLEIPLYWMCGRAYAAGDAVVSIKRIETFDDYAAELRRHAREVVATRAGTPLSPSPDTATPSRR